MALRELYQEMILDHGKRPRNVGVLPAATHEQIGHNPVCGDKLTVYVLVENGLVLDLRFEGAGCAISMASASLMTEVVRGLSLDAFYQLFDHFHHLVTAGKEPAADIGKLAIFAGVAEFPVRVKCATLAWHTLKAALLKDEKTVSTESA